MDFLFHELSRQQAALAALLLGREGNPLPETPGSSKHPQPLSKEIPETGGLPEPGGSSETAPVRQRFLRRASENPGDGALPAAFPEPEPVLPASFPLESPASGPAGRRWQAGETPWPSSRNPAASETLESLGRPGSRGPSSDDAPAAVGTFGETGGAAGKQPLLRLTGPSASALGPAPARTAQDAGTEMARQMSLAFQRDARRYDGGFVPFD